MSDNIVQITLELPAFEALRMHFGHPDDPGEFPWCKGCYRDFQEGETIVYLASRRMHEGCARKRLPADHPADAWLMIAEHVAQYPSRHSAEMIRTVMHTLVAMIKANEQQPAQVTA